MLSFYDNFSGKAVQTPIGAKSVAAKIGQADVRDLQFWRDNPRIRDLLGFYKDAGRAVGGTQDEIRKLLTEQHEVVQLAETMLAYGPGIGPVWVLSDGTVVEGNRRVCASRINLEKGHQEFSKILAIVLPPDCPDIQGEIYKHHVVGPKRWTPSADAAYTQRLINDHVLTEAQVIQMSRRPLSVVRNRFQAQKLCQHFVEKYFAVNGKRPEDSGIKAFSSFERFMKIEGRLVQEMGMRKSQVRSWFEGLMLAGRINDCQHVERLPSIVTNQAARKALETEGSYAAMRLDPRPVAVNAIRVIRKCDQMGAVLEKTAVMLKESIVKKNLFDAKLPAGKDRLCLLIALRDAIDAIMPRRAE